MKTENFNFLAQYQAPGVKMVKLCPRGHFLQQVSPYGEVGAAGAQGGFYDETIGDDNDY